MAVILRLAPAESEAPCDQLHVGAAPQPAAQPAVSDRPHKKDEVKPEKSSLLLSLLVQLHLSSPLLVFPRPYITSPGTDFTSRMSLASSSAAARAGHHGLGDAFASPPLIRNRRIQRLLAPKTPPKSIQKDLQKDLSKEFSKEFKGTFLYISRLLSLLLPRQAQGFQLSGSSAHDAIAAALPFTALAAAQLTVLQHSQLLLRQRAVTLELQLPYFLTSIESRCTSS